MKEPVGKGSPQLLRSLAIAAATALTIIAITTLAVAAATAIAPAVAARLRHLD